MADLKLPSFSFHACSDQRDQKLKKSPNFYGVDSLVKDTKNENPINLMSDFLYEIEQNIEKLANGKKTQIIKEWTKKSETIGKKVTVNTLGGKISGAGGGGFLLLVVEREKQNIFFNMMSKYKELPFSFEPSGSRVIFDYRTKSR